MSMYVENNAALRRGRMSRDLPSIRPPARIERLVPRRLLDDAMEKIARLEIELGWARRKIELLQGKPFEMPAPAIVKPPASTPIAKIPVPAPTPEDDPNKLRMGVVVRTVCEYFGISKAELTGRIQARRVCHPRMIAAWLGCRCGGMSLAFVGRFLGNRDHTTIRHARIAINELLKAGDKRIIRDVEALLQKLGLPSVPIF